MNDKYFNGNLFEEIPADHFHKKVLTPITKENEREMCREFMAAIFGIK